jgi:hypothetical protein
LPPPKAPAADVEMNQEKPQNMRENETLEEKVEALQQLKKTPTNQLAKIKFKSHLLKGGIKLSTPLKKMKITS